MLPANRLLCLTFNNTNPNITSFFDSGSSAAAIALDDYFNSPPDDHTIADWVNIHEPLLKYSFNSIVTWGITKSSNLIASLGFDTILEIFTHYARIDESNVIVSSEFKRFAILLRKIISHYIQIQKTHVSITLNSLHYNYLKFTMYSIRHITIAGCCWMKKIVNHPLLKSYYQPWI